MTSNSTEQVTRALAGAGYQNDWYEASQSFPQLFASAAQQYRDRYRDPLYDMARIAAKNHANALANLLAQMRREMTADHCNVVFKGAHRAISSALQQANVTLANIDFAEIHDCFTIVELLIYEAMGLAPRGDGFRVLDEGTVFSDGRLPVNLSGGLKAKGHPVGATGVSMHALAFKQLTGTPIGIPATNAEFGLVFNMGGMAVANYASVLQALRA
jgi:acetyl-CoA C-acetyltransferase